ncbi:hypothetical protein GW915_01080 [bacterium]|nr:hypothetical protein [bacterium]
MAKDMEINSAQWVHFIAVGGKGMGALAVLMSELGYMVTGSDGVLYPPMDVYLEKSLVKVSNEYSKDNLLGQTWGLSKKHPDIVIVGNAISRGHVEAEVAAVLDDEKKIRRMSFSEALAEFAIAENKSFVVTGTHGKSTTSSMLAWAFERLNLTPGFFIGAIPNNFDTCCRQSGEGQVFVSEGDEYDTVYWDKVSKFLYYKPDWVICTGVEFDHADIFKDLAAIEDSFLELVKKTKDGWVLVEDESAPEPKVTASLSEAVKKKGLPCLRYGFSDRSDFYVSKWHAKTLSSDGHKVGTSFIVEYKGCSKSFYSSMIGKHNVLNALSAIAVIVAAGKANFSDLDSNLFADYSGIAKRQQELFYSEQSVLVDDFAHHPRAIFETLNALKLRYPGRFVRAFFEPRSATSARNLLFDSFVKCFDPADEVYLIEATKKNVPMDQRLNVVELKRQIEAHGPKVFLAKDYGELVGLFETRNQSEEELIVLMSNGSFGGIAEKLLEQLS